VEDLKARISDVATLMDEFRLSEAELSDEGVRIAFRRRSAAPPKARNDGEVSDAEPAFDILPEQVAELPQAGTPVTSPMTGIYYSAPSPSAPSFVKEGEPVTAGQVVGLIEAMKVFNEITAPTSGIVLKALATNGQLVQPGDPLLYIG
jgi:acetyl-CoA carboxylase biotin carboxyl carrier protein